MTPEIHLARFRRIAQGFVGAVQRDVIPFPDACNLIESTAHAGKPTRDLPPDQQAALATYGIQCLTDALINPELAAAAEIRVALGPMMEARKPRSALLIAAYRVANARLPAAQVEQIVQEQIAAFMARVKGERRHA